jgi:membrane-bound lytic murein transglycosylase F
MRLGSAFLLGMLLLASCTNNEISISNKKLKVFEEFRFEPNHLQAIQERSRLRAITYFNSMSYFINEGTEMGFEYALASEFADWLGVELEIVIPPSSSAVYDWLEDNGGDLIIMPHDRTRLLPGTLKLSDNYATSYDVVMTLSNNKKIQNTQDLNNKTVYVIRKSQQHHALNQLIQNKQLDINIKQLPEDHSDEELLELLANGSIEAIAIEGRFANLALQSKYKQLRRCADWSTRTASRR